MRMDRPTASVNVLSSLMGLHQRQNAPMDKQPLGVGYRFQKIMTFTIPIHPGAIRRPTTHNLSGIVTIHGLRWQQPKSVGKLDRVLLAVCSVFELDEERLLSHAKPEAIAWPRQIAMALAHENGIGSLSEIGRRLGNRSHGTVWQGIRRVKARCETDARSRSQFERVKGMLE